MGNNQRRLTIRQKEVLQALGDGLSIKEIAARLTISQRTVRGHIEVLKRKFSARTKEQLMAKASFNNVDSG